MDVITAFANINWLSVIVASISAFVVGGIWYGPLFGMAWMKEFGFTEDNLKKRKMPKVFGLSMVLMFIAALDLEMFLGPDSDVASGVTVGFVTGFGWVATFIGVLYLFEMRSFKAFIINAGYCTVSLTLMGAILGAW